MSNATEFLNNPACSADVYEVDSEDTYSRCKVSQAKFVFYTLAGIYIVVIIVLIALMALGGASATFLPVFLIGGLIVILTAINAFWLADYTSRRAHRASEYEIESTMNAHDGKISRGEAVNIIRQEKLAREQAAATMRAARHQADASLRGSLAIADALRRPREK